MLLLMESLQWPRIMGDWRSGVCGETGIWSWGEFLVGVGCQEFDGVRSNGTVIKSVLYFFFILCGYIDEIYTYLHKEKNLSPTFL